MRSTLLAFGPPPDAVAWVALGLALLALALAFRTRSIAALIERHPRALVAALAASAALLSAGYLHFYLRGAPRIVDATSYFLEGRALASGLLSFEVPAPSGSFRGRFLIPTPETGALSVLFPPGYPALLALGFALGEPLALGPLLAAALVFVTYALALRLFESQRIALSAALLGVLCAALRYHTADTMSHGLGALLWTSALLAALRGGRWLLLAGVAIGWLLATRPVTGVAASVLVLVVSRTHGAKSLGWLALGALPGLALLALHQHAATGSWLGSTQLRYYALADGPPGCFRYGFGDGVGCRFEHGDFVRARLDGGFGALAAIGTTARRLHHHLLDVANFEPLALFVPVAAFVGRHERRVRWLALGVMLLVLAYVPFYFDATYPGGGARLYAEVLPLEHVLVAWVLERFSLARFAPAAALAGFSVHASFSHRALADREGGRPMFESAVLERAGVRSGLVFVTTDHGFNLGHRPSGSDLVIARLRRDGHDHALWERLGRPPAYRYLYDPWTRGAVPSLEPYLPPPSTRFEAEAQWPVLSIGGGYAMPDFPGGDCKSGGAALRLAPAPGPVDARFEVLAATPGRYRLIAGWVASHGAEVEIRAGASRVFARPGPGCFQMVGPIVDLGTAPLIVDIRVSESTGWLDYLELGSATSAHPSPGGSGKKR